MTFEEHLAGHTQPPVDVDVPAGWEHLVEQMHDEIVAIDPDYTVGQVKEKFGGLRFYIDVSDHVRDNDDMWSEIYRIIEFYEAKSYTVCQDCGNKGWIEQNPTGEFRWVATLCNACRRTRNRSA